MDTYLDINFGKGAQGIIRGKQGAQEDKETKMASVNHFIEELPGSINIFKKYSTVIDEYYKNYS